MDATQWWYPFALSGIIGLPILGYFLLAITTFVYLTFLDYPLSLAIRKARRPLRAFTRVTWGELMVYALFLAANIVYLVVTAKDAAGFIKRAGLASTINLIPLSLGGHMNIIASSLGIKVNTYARVHRWVGRVTIVEGLIHVIVAVALRRSNLHSRSATAGFVATATFGAILCSGLLRRYLYEIFLPLHLGFATAAIVALYVHCLPGKLIESPSVFLLAATILQVIIGATRLGQIVYRNVVYRKPKNWAIIRKLQISTSFAEEAGPSEMDAVQVHVRLSRPWRPQAGQYAYLCIRGLSNTPIAQFRPFYISWWYQDGNDHYIVFIIQRMSGFTKNLYLHHCPKFTESFLDRIDEEKHQKMCAYEYNNENRVYYKKNFKKFEELGKLPAIIEGPYGKGICTDFYDIVFLFATGIGIAGQLPYINQLLDRHDEGKVKHVYLLWETKAETHAGWTVQEITALFARDDYKKIFDCTMYTLGKSQSYDDGRMHFIQSDMNESQIKSAIDRGIASSNVRQEGGQAGRILVSICTNDRRNKDIRKVVETLEGSTKNQFQFDVEELDFRPSRSREQRFKDGVFGKMSEMQEVKSVV